MEKTITVTGKGTVFVVPDVTRLNVGINGIFGTYDEAYAKAKENSSWIVKVLEYNHLDGKLAKTLKFDISDHMVSQYDKYGHYTQSKKEGFDLKQKIKIDLGMDNVLLNKIIKGIGKYIDNAQIDIGYTVKDPHPFELKMLERAVKDAREKASIMASAAGCKLGDVNSVNYSVQEIEIYSPARSIHSNDEAKCCKPESLDITPDNMVISDEVTVVWYLVTEHENNN